MENEQNTDLEQEQIEETVDSTEEETSEDYQVDTGDDYKTLYDELLHRHKKLKRKLFTKEEPVKKIITNSDTKWRERMELKVEGYDEQAIDFIQKNGGKKALDNPYLIKAIEAMREQKIAEKATIDAGSKSQTEKRYSPQEFAKLSASEQLKALSEL